MYRLGRVCTTLPAAMAFVRRKQEKKGEESTLAVPEEATLLIMTKAC